MTTVHVARRANAEFEADVVAGLSQPHKRLPSKYFYDATGSRLFDCITALDVYYPTRTELTILRSNAASIAAHCGPCCLLIELGAGSLVKARLLLERLDRPAGYVPIDVSGDHLHVATRGLTSDYPSLSVNTVVADFTGPFEVPAIISERRVVFFPGSTLGNFDPDEADNLLRRIARLVKPGGGLLLGVDLRKDRSVLEPAYNDICGVTAEFNRNLLVRINRELGADFDPNAFRHHAFYNHRLSRVEMHLISIETQVVRIGNHTFAFRPGESIHTENSYKYDIGELTSRATECGFSTDATWVDENHYFAVLYLAATGQLTERRT
jgi:L-histidine N-alpha-methyltransferase